MISPFDVWAPMFRAPFSGDVTQEITPHFFSPDIKGIPEIEHKVQTQVASYGKQLGKILEALKVLSDKADVPLPDIVQLIEDIEEVKMENCADIRADAEAAMERLRRADKKGWQEVVQAQTTPDA